MAEKATKRKMVNNSLETSENEMEPISSNDDIANGQVLSGCSSNGDGAPPQKRYARRRKCNENVQVCEKQKKRESYQRVRWNSITFSIQPTIQFGVRDFFSLNSQCTERANVCVCARGIFVN